MSALEDKLDAIQKKETREMLTSLSDQLVSSAPSSMSANLSSHPARVHNQLILGLIQKFCVVSRSCTCSLFAVFGSIKVTSTQIRTVIGSPTGPQ